MVYRRLVPLICLLVCTTGLVQAQSIYQYRQVTSKNEAIRLKDFFELIRQQTGAVPLFNDSQLNADELISVDFYQEPLENVLAELFSRRGMTWTFRDETYIVKKIPNWPGGRLITCIQENMRLADFFTTVWYQTKMQAFYNDEQLSSDERVSVKFEKVPLEKVLGTILKDRELTWYYREETFVIVPRKKRKVNESLLELERRKIVGTVVDDEGTPIEGAVVMEKQGPQGTYTEKDGRFVLAGIPSGSHLLARKSGYKTRELSKYPDTLFVRLEEQIAALKEVKVKGWLKRLLTGSASTVQADEIAMQPSSNVLSALQGRVPGLFLSQTTGLPGGGFRIRLRGRNSIDSDSDPLIVIDGIPFAPASFNENLLNLVGSGSGLGANVAASPLNLLPIQDIASVDILRDADATALYGARGANGVILITSKTPEKGTNRLNLNYYTGVGKVSKTIRYLNTTEYLQMRREALTNDDATAGATDFDLVRWDTTRYTDWQKELIGGVSHIRNASLELTGGNELAVYRVSGMFREEGTVYTTDDFNYRKGGGRVQLNLTTPDKKLKFNLSGSYMADRNRLPQTDLTILSNTSPNSPEPYVNGRLNFADSTFDNPFGYLMRVYTGKSELKSAQAVLNLQPLSSLFLKATFGINDMKNTDVQVNPVSSFNPNKGFKSSFSNFSNSQFRNWMVDMSFDWKRSNEKHYLHLIGGLRLQEEGQDLSNFYGSGFPDDASLNNMAAADSLATTKRAYTNFRNEALYTRLEYRYKGKYLLSLTGSRDRSTRLSPGKQYANFGAIGAGWVFTREAWLRPNKVLSFGKLRASVGWTGNDRYRRDVKHDTYIPWPANGWDGELNSEGRPTITWEKLKKREIALELGLAEDRIMVTVNHYKNVSSNQLLSGMQDSLYFPINWNAKVENKGWEVDIEASIFKRNRFGWTATLNLSFPRNSLLSFDLLKDFNYQNYYQEGMSLDMVKGFKVTGVNPQTGVYQFADPDKNGVGLEDFHYGNALGPVLYGGMQHNLIYDRFELNVLFRFVRQRNFNYQFSWQAAPGGMANQPATVLQRWQKEGDITDWQKFTASLSSEARAAYMMALTSDRQVMDANYLRLQSLMFAYHLPSKILERIKIKSSKLYMQGLNLFTITKYPGRDPETTAAAEVYPSLRIITAGIQVTF
ncbi:SusC/RagA family TonB-linked outer membrane protein [Olivibacter jilunii]|uniref:SusC/RagA family TonB-linked outer membrane protein n=1 Tax=Olivibacter jilunii TaxID=985016 RepID=UPI00102FD7AF|nr:SusC/RagA family TonB-linked outer membrane protein [Olivibacter jilunii]